LALADFADVFRAKLSRLYVNMWLLVAASSALRWEA